MLTVSATGPASTAAEPATRPSAPPPPGAGANLGTSPAADADAVPSSGGQPIGFRSAQSTLDGETIATIQDLPASALPSPQEQAMASVKAWVKTAMAAADRGTPGLEDPAGQPDLGTPPPPLTLEQEQSLTPAELRVYVEARHW
jgi:hypothetical protein